MAKLPPMFGLAGRNCKLVYTFDDLLAEAAKVAPLLTAKSMTVATAESFTGGLISAALTSIPGSSKYYSAGMVAYSNDAKIFLLGVRKPVIESEGAVSPECAEAMALGMRERADSSLGLATTGIAGPDGGTRSKPVGLVYIAVTNSIQTYFKRFKLKGDRWTITVSGATLALAILYDFVNLITSENNEDNQVSKDSD